MICKTCGTPILPGAKICTKCGTPVASPSGSGSTMTSSDNINSTARGGSAQSSTGVSGTSAGVDYRGIPPYAQGTPPPTYGQVPNNQYGQNNYGQTTYMPLPPKKGVNKIILFVCAIIILGVLAFAFMPKSNPPPQGGGTIGTGMPPGGGGTPPQQLPPQNPPPQNPTPKQGEGVKLEFKTINVVINDNDLIPVGQSQNVMYMLVRSSIKKLPNGIPYAWVLTANPQKQLWTLGEVAFNTQELKVFLGKAVEKDARTGQESATDINKEMSIDPNSPLANARAQVMAILK